MAMKHPEQGLADTRKPKLPAYEVGDTVDVHVKIREGDKERIQVFTGTVIRERGAGLSKTFTVRRVVQGEGVERIFPIHAPTVSAVKVIRKGKVRRAKLHYLRDRVGKSTRLRERLGVRIPGEDEPVPEGAPAAPEAPAGAAPPTGAAPAAAAPAPAPAGTKPPAAEAKAPAPAAAKAPEKPAEKPAPPAAPAKK